MGRPPKLRDVSVFEPTPAMRAQIARAAAGKMSHQDIAQSYGTTVELLRADVSG